MDIENLAQLFEILADAYPETVIGERTTEVYTRCLSDLPLPALTAAVLSHVTNNKWFPKVAELREAAVSSMPQGQIPNAGEAWEQVERAIGDVGIYGDPAERFSRSVVGRAVQAMGWRNLCQSENPMADRAQFQRIYNDLASRERQEALMLPEVKQLTARLAEQLKSPEAAPTPELPAGPRKLVDVNEGLRALAGSKRAAKPVEQRVITRGDIDESRELWHIVDGERATLCGAPSAGPVIGAPLTWGTLCERCRERYNGLGAMQQGA